jgi:polysaccharide deacetylase 2 family uncharacterized protein YibQ
MPKKIKQRKTSPKTNTKKKNSKRKKTSPVVFNYKPYLYALAFLFVGGFLFVSFYVFFEKSNSKKEMAPKKTQQISQIQPVQKPDLSTKPILQQNISIFPEVKPQLEEKKEIPQIVVTSPLPDIKPVHIVPKNPQIAIVLDDMGVDIKRSARAMSLPKEINLSFLAYSKQIQEQTKKARDKGHELLVHIPMEANSGKDAGYKTLLVKDSEKILQSNLDWHLSQFEGYIGINNHMGSKFTSQKESLQKIMNKVKEKKLFFLDSKTSNATLVPNIAKECGVPCIEREIFLDHVVTSKAIQGQLKLLEEVATKKGFAIAIGHPKDETLTELEKWIPTLQQKGYNLVPISALVLPWQ